MSTQETAGAEQQAQTDERQKLQAQEKVSIKDVNLDDRAGSPQYPLPDRLYRMIDYAVKRHDWYADQCHRLLQIGLALIATGIAALALFAKIDSLVTLSAVLAWLVGISMFCTGLSLVYLYLDGVSVEHPYRKVVDIHSWYFAYKFSGTLNMAVSRESEKAAEQVTQESKYIAEYFDSFVKHSADAKNLLREDIEQVAILFILQRYRRQLSQKMVRWLFWGLLVTLILTTFLGLSWVLTRPATASSPGATEPAAAGTFGGTGGTADGGAVSNATTPDPIAPSPSAKPRNNSGGALPPTTETAPAPSAAPKEREPRPPSDGKKCSKHKKREKT